MLLVLNIPFWRSWLYCAKGMLGCDGACCPLAQGEGVSAHFCGACCTVGPRFCISDLWVLHKHIPCLPLPFLSLFFVAVASCNLLAFLLMCWHSARSVQWVPFDSVIKLGKRCGRRTRFLFVAGFVDILT